MAPRGGPHTGGGSGGAAAVAAALLLLCGGWLLWQRREAGRAEAARLASEAGEIALMQREIGEQIRLLERNLTTVKSYFATLRERLKARQDDSELSSEALDQLDDATVGSVHRLAKSFREQAAELSKVSQHALDEFKQYLDNQRGGRWLVKWHGNNGITTSPRFASEEQAYQYYVQAGDFAKKLLMFDGARWILIKSYGGQQWLSLMTDDATYQQGKPATSAPH
eukprot:TRINITY_DN71855_c0_g1_i1.p1 TRINITY_DN71855_c0_g1~~TRINITY_DN71855_c0_g1_i1.p1  ORF type:complete len:263 (+),score=96.92 TRINITY_DN71855_c0_g1_i1:119-790(+)